MFPLPDLPWAYDALAPTISERTLHFHHDKHHATYVKTLNELVKDSGKSWPSLEALIVETAKSGPKKLFNNAAQAWNHAFFWASMWPRRQNPAGDLAAAIAAAFGSQEKFRTAFVAAGADHFGSGWVWLAADRGGAVKVISTHDADDTLTTQDLTPLVVCDLWEHAYYLDYQNDRKAFLEAWFDALPHWNFAAGQLAAAKGAGKPWCYPAEAASSVAA
ncbi:MAG: superoxide dismutase [Caulobacteraceae bacterium]